MMRILERQWSVPGRRRLFIAWGLVALWMAAIFYVSAVNTWTVFDGPPVVGALRKCGHVFEYAVLGLLLGHALVTTWGDVTRALLLKAWRVGTVIALIYAATDEFHQSFVPKRVGYGWDVLVDALSATAALGIWYIVRTRSLGRARTGTPDLARGKTTIES